LGWSREVPADIFESATPNITAMNAVHAITIPLFIALICIELFLSYREDRENLDLLDVRMNLKIGAIGVLVNAVLKAASVAFFLFLFQYRLFNFELNIASGLVLFLLVDLLYYLFHMLGHKSRFFWALHVIHHSSEKYNLTTALRIPFTNTIFRYGMLILPVMLGYHPVHVLFIDSIMLSITFLQHTENVGKLGWLEYIFNTPSHHRVHHARNEEYLDKNMGGVLIIWDKMFGTFEPERAKPIYGLTKPVNLRSVKSVVTHELTALWRDLENKDLFTRLRILFANPSWRPGEQKLFRTRRPLFYPSFVIILLVLHMPGTNVFAQMAEGLRYEAQGKYDLARAAFESEIKSSGNPDAYARAAMSIAKLAGTASSREEKLTLAVVGRDVAFNGLTVTADHQQIRLALIVNLGIMSEASSSPSQKLAYAKVIRAEAEKLIRQDSLFAPGYYILGKWHYELAKLNWAERLVCNSLFGGVPKDVSFEKSLSYLNKAVRLDPNYILFHFAMACSLYQVEQFTYAASELRLALALPALEPEDKLRKEQCSRLLERTRTEVD
jgi:sterol desaturase/sphingolipid hydroxylase (fatty acid hydroxylase superfamily)/tetratricopeptide (TPR) repeat protein